MSFDSSLNITLDSNHDAIFNVSGNERLRIDSLGNVGIGTTSPATHLSLGVNSDSIPFVVGSYEATYPPLLNIRDDNYDDNCSIAHFSRGNSVFQLYGNGLYHQRGTGDIAAFYTTSGHVYVGNSSRSSYIRFNTDNNILLETTGNVGIGLDYPSTLLHVNGDITASTVNANLTGNVTGNVTGDVTGNVSGSVNASSISCTGNVSFNRNYNGYFVKFGIDGGYQSPPTGRLYCINTSDNNNNITVYAAGFDNSSDDRLKTNEVLITNATNTIMKLSPQIYEKYGNVEHTKGSWTESGLIAQDVWYNTPELRHIVSLPIDASGNESVPLPLPEGVNTQQNIQQDIDYVSLGWSSNDTASLNYIQLIPYLIKSNQEQQELINSQNSEINILKTQLADVLQRLTNANI